MESHTAPNAQQSQTVEQQSQTVENLVDQHFAQFGSRPTQEQVTDFITRALNAVAKFERPAVKRTATVKINTIADSEDDWNSQVMEKDCLRLYVTNLLAPERADTHPADQLAMFLKELLCGIEDGPDGLKKTRSTLELALEMTFLHSPAYEAARHLYSKWFEIRGHYTPQELINSVIAKYVGLESVTEMPITESGLRLVAGVSPDTGE